MIDEYKAAGVPPRDVFPQSFDKNDVLYWIQKEPTFGRQAVYLDDANTVADLPSLAELQGLSPAGHPDLGAAELRAARRELAERDRYVTGQPRTPRAAGLDIITWSLERSGILANVNGDFYYQTFESAITREGDLMRGHRRAGTETLACAPSSRTGRRLSPTTPTAWI